MLERGARLGPYEIETLLGRGGMGEVYRGRDTRLRRPVAIKVLAPGLVRSPDAIARFRREAETASALNHPHVLTILDIGEADAPGGVRVHYLAMEFIEGRTLREVMHDSGSDRLQSLRWMQQVTSGLAKAHAAGIVHRDLKPDNVMITEDGFAKILDFGLAKLVEPDDLEAATRGLPYRSETGLLMGTVGYMSPEQAAGRAVDFRSDQFAVGCILYEMLSGRQPFRGDTVVDTLHQVMHVEPPPLAGQVSIGISRIVRTCLEKDPQRRYQSTRDLAHDLAEAIEATASGVIEPRAGSATARMAAVESSSRLAAGERSIAVLPFADLSPARDHEYIGDGLADEIITDLSRLRGLRVIARPSAMQYRRTEKPTSQIARELDVEYVLTGSVRIAGGRLRIATQLVRAADDTNLWVDRMDGTLDDIFDIQEKVARTVAEQLRVQLSPEESGALRARQIPNVVAFECYLRARRHIWDFTAASLQKALDDIHDAERLVGENPLLLASQAYVYWQYYNAGIDPKPDYLDKADGFVRRLAAIDPESFHIDLLRGLIDVHRGDIASAVRYLRRALTRDRSDVDALTWLVILLCLAGYAGEARPLAHRLRELDPLGWMSRLGLVATAFYGGDFDLAVKDLSVLVPSDYDVSICALIVVQLYAQVGRMEDAAAVARPMMSRDPNDPFARLGMMFIDALQGRPEEARARITTDLLAIMRADLQYSSWMADVFALIGDRDAAFDWLSHAIGRGFINYPLIARHDRLLDNLRTDPRFDPLVADLRTRWLAFQN
jgi:serine/threonine-protein kinase